ncbi:MAG: 3-phosphoshikimate 1-carboxyvinyltransferase [Bacteroidetes bacterium]|nr:MAG: 3-phosphoshikimate 1-carboxyvinyltransferase [Bacteroidota bacterium]
MNQIIHSGNYRGKIQVPPSKSDAQRAILAAGLAQGTSHLTNYGNSDDELVMQNFIRQIGAEIIEKKNRVLRVNGTNSFPSEATFQIGESGLSARLITAICAAHPGHFIIKGEGSLLERPMHSFQDILPMFGIHFQSNQGFLPLHISGGPMQGKKAQIDSSTGSQYLSGLLMALPMIDEDSSLNVHQLVSRPYVEMTLRTMSKFGVFIEQDSLQTFHIKGKQKYLPASYYIESDWSSASYWLVASALGLEIETGELNPQSLQADRLILSAFKAANCEVEFHQGNYKIHGKFRQAFEFDATHCPDLFPALTTFASLCPGTTILKGLKRLRYKESNRGEALQTEFAKLGVQIDLKEDEMFIHGRDQLRGAQVNSHRDHRIAMCLAIAGMFSETPIEISDSEAASKSYPEFWDHLNSLKTENQ